jgi:hypothetical protein
MRRIPIQYLKFKKVSDAELKDAYLAFCIATNDPRLATSFELIRKLGFHTDLKKRVTKPA